MKIHLNTNYQQLMNLKFETFVFQIYEEIARKNKEDYDKKMDIWENEMIALGRFDVLRKKTLNKLKER